MQTSQDTPRSLSVESDLSIFWIFLKLGLTSFGGPIAHLGYFREEFVTRRRWLSDESYGDLVALCQFIPGPASSQVGFALGLLRGNGLTGGIAAWLGFTLPSAVLLLLFALSTAVLTGNIAQGFIHGLKLVAVAVVAQAVWGMARSLAPDGPRAAISVGAIILIAFIGGTLAQITAIALGGLAGILFCRAEPKFAQTHTNFPISHRAGLAALTLFVVLLGGLPLLAGVTEGWQLSLFDSFYRSGALVFGGGHVVLPLLEAEMVTPGGISKESFLAGYGLAQAVPGPLFTFAAYLGAQASLPSNGIGGAAIALIAVFLPGLLLIYGMLPFWDRLRMYPTAQFAMRGANAAVVGILAIALYDPVWTSAVLNAKDFAVAITGFLMLTFWKLAPWLVVAILGVAGVFLRLL